MPAADDLPGPIATTARPGAAGPIATAPSPGPTGSPSTGADGAESGGDAAVIDDLEAILDGVDAALRRLDDGTYGRCRSCGGAVDDARLAGDPVA